MPEAAGRRRWRQGAREGYVQDLEEERDMLEARLRRLEREFEDLRRPSDGPERQAGTCVRGSIRDRLARSGEARQV
jgi:hypothetical protein